MSASQSQGLIGNVNTAVEDIINQCAEIRTGIKYIAQNLLVPELKQLANNQSKEITKLQ